MQKQDCTILTFSLGVAGTFAFHYFLLVILKHLLTVLWSSAVSLGCSPKFEVQTLPSYSIAGEKYIIV